MHTCLDQYNTNKTGTGNGGLKWIQKGGGYYSECNKRLKGWTSRGRGAHQSWRSPPPQRSAWRLARLRRDGVRHRYLFDLEPVHSPERIARPPAVSRFVIAVVAAEARWIELGYGRRIFPEVEKRLQRLAGRDLTVFGKNAAHNLKHEGPPWFLLNGGAVHALRCRSLTVRWRRGSPSWGDTQINALNYDQLL
jgi:hypothetical protein